MALRDSVTVTDAEERVLVRGLQLVLIGILVFGAVKRNPSVAINAAGALLVSALPALLRREVGLRMDVGLVLWLTAAVLLHAIGILGPYQETWWWDYLTHAFSASIIAGIGFAVVRAIDRHSEEIHLPEPFLSLFLFLSIVAIGVLWELLEFAVTLGSEALGVESVLVIFGVEDIILDLVFTTIGGLLVVIWGRGYFRDLARKLNLVLFRRGAE